ncbi:hypothetical protein WJX81_001035 [Elliptochloris bilobata]|uniref:Kinetochore protein Nuf2 n=1 Tax=Elliptochloris bilobata TaxID=381761 RepID=A0AAW1SEJ6_9CHLO
MAQTFSFPILSDAELLPCLKDMELPLNAAGLAKPTPELVRPVYESVVTTLVGVTREELQQPVFTAIDALEFPELHDESIPFMAFLKQLTKLMAAAGVRDFTMQDICKPDSTRLRRNLSAVINFAKFREEKLGPFTELQEGAEALLEQSAALEQQQRRLAAELKQLQEERAAQQPEAAAVEAEASELYAENQALNRQQTALNAEVRTLKGAANAAADEAASAKFRLQTARQAASELRELIVESPEKLQARLRETAGAVERERARLADAERHSRDLQTRLDAIAKVEKEVGKARSVMGEVETELGRKKEASRRVKALRAQIAASEAEAASLGARQQHLERQRASLAERLQRLEHQAELRKEAAASAIEEQLKDKEATEADNAANLAKLAEHEALMRALRERMREVAAAHEAQTSAVLGRYAALRAEVSAYHRRLAAAMAAGESRALAPLDTNVSPNAAPAPACKAVAAGR